MSVLLKFYFVGPWCEASLTAMALALIKRFSWSASPLLSSSYPLRNLTQRLLKSGTNNLVAKNKWDRSVLLVKFPQGSTDRKLISALRQYSDITLKTWERTERVIEAMEIILSPLVIYMAGMLKKCKWVKLQNIKWQRQEHMWPKLVLIYTYRCGIKG